MRKIILQHCVDQTQQGLLDMSIPFNKEYSKKHGFEHIISNGKRRLGDDKPLNFEKLAFISEKLARIEDGGLVVWLDSDSVCANSDESFEKALGPYGVFGMVRQLGGIDMKQTCLRWNSGTIVMKNIHIVRDFVKRSLNRNAINDETAMMNELNENGFMLGEGYGLTSIDNKWNCWRNNWHVCQNPVVRSWHGYKGDAKFTAMKDFISNLSKSQ